jgi:outer membrane protein
MKRLFTALTITIACAFTAFAQTPTPPARPATSTPAPSSSAAAIPGGTGAEGKLAYLNTAQFRQGVLELKAKLDTLNTEFEPKRKEVQAIEEEINKLKNQIQTQGSTVSAQVRQQWAEQGAELEKKYKRMGEDYETQGQRRLGEVSGPIYEKISNFLSGYCQQRGIVMVIEGGAAQQAGVLLFASPATDITEDFIKEYNKANPSTAGAVPARK